MSDWNSFQGAAFGRFYVSVITAIIVITFVGEAIVSISWRVARSEKSRP